MAAGPGPVSWLALALSAAVYPFVQSSLLWPRSAGGPPGWAAFFITKGRPSGIDWYPIFLRLGAGCCRARDVGITGTMIPVACIKTG